MSALEGLPRPANDVLTYMPPAIACEALHEPVRATLHDDGAVVGAGVCVYAAGWGAMGPEKAPLRIPLGWLAPFCRALLDAGIAGDRPLIVWRRGSIAGVYVPVDRGRSRRWGRLMGAALISARPDAGQVSRMLAGQVLRLAPELLPAGKRCGAEWRAGSVSNERGQSLAVHLGGGKPGVWADFSTGESGDALDLVAAVLFRGDRKAAYAWGLRWLGLGDGGAAPAVQAAYRPTREAAPDAQADAAKRDAAALGIWLAAEPQLQGTPAAAYLAARGIDLARFGRQPRALRYSPACWCAEAGQRLPALLALAADGDGKPAALHRTYLARLGGVWGKANLADAKKSLGRVRGASVRLTNGASGKRLGDAPAGERVVIGEGLETCLTVAVAAPELRVLCGISLSNMANVVLPPAVSTVVLLADNDSGAGARRGLQRAIDAHAAAGRVVRIARSPVGKDFNDCVRANG